MIVVPQHKSRNSPRGCYALSRGLLNGTLSIRLAFEARSSTRAKATMSSVPHPRPPLGRRMTGMKKKNVVMASHGRAPWYGPDGKVIEAYVIGIAGGSASGKVSVLSDPKILLDPAFRRTG